MTYLYIVLAANGLCKIGKSDNVRGRIRQLRSASPVQCALCSVIRYDDEAHDLEKELHGKFADKRVRGEWFALDKNELLPLIPDDDDELINILSIFLDTISELANRELSIAKGVYPYERTNEHSAAGST